MKLRALARELHLDTSDYTTFRGLVRQMIEEGALRLGPGRTLRLPEQRGLLTGTFRASRRGFGFLERPGQPDLYVRAEHTGGALEGDTVTARLLRVPGPLGPRAEVVRILQRAPLRWVGVLERYGDRWRVRPQGRAPLPAVRIDEPAAQSAQPGDLVVVEPRAHTIHAGHVAGRILERLGRPDEARAQILGVLRRQGLPSDFAPDVRQAARSAAAAFDPEHAGPREDRRDLLTITIDPADARDFDDAISLEPLDDGRVRLGVHIADVSHFVPLDGPVDLEARQRGTSVYFPGHVVPMLPEELSNGVCSLQPGEPRLTRSVYLTYDRRGALEQTRLAGTLIRSRARLSYDEVTVVLERGARLVPPDIAKLLHDAEDLARLLRRRRQDAGMIALNLPEADIRLDAQGRVVDAGPQDTSFSHTIIEMFMVAANEAVSRALTAAGLPHLRRIHPPPAPEDAAALTFLAPLLGHAPPRSLDRAVLNRLLDEVRGQPAEAVVHYLLLRALPQASYSPEDAGHFALASDDYCHFTSPIRRYPDLTVHRLFDLLLRSPGGRVRRPRRRPEVAADVELADLGRRASAAERRAQQAEREARRLLLLTLMRDKLGAELDGLITGVASFGVFVQVQPYMAEGVIGLADFGPGPWEFERDLLVFRMRRTGRIVHVGQRVRVRVAAVDDLRQELTLVPAGGGLGALQPVAHERRPARRRTARAARRGGRMRRA